MSIEAFSLYLLAKSRTVSFPDVESAHSSQAACCPRAIDAATGNDKKFDAGDHARRSVSAPGSAEPSRSFRGSFSPKLPLTAFKVHQCKQAVQKVGDS